MSATMPIPAPSEMFTLLLCTVRYALGRRSYVVNDAVSLYEKFSGYLTPTWKQVILRDIEQELRMAGEIRRTVGDPMDHAAWVRLAERITADIDATAPGSREAR